MFREGEDWVDDDTKMQEKKIASVSLLSRMGAEKKRTSASSNAMTFSSSMLGSISTTKGCPRSFKKVNSILQLLEVAIKPGVWFTDAGCAEG